MLFPRSMIYIDGAYLLHQEQKMLHFCSHDYLGLSDNNLLKKQAMKYLLQYGVGTPYQEENCFEQNYQIQLKEKFSSFLGREKVLFFSMRDHVNTFALSRIALKVSYIFIDEASHSSLFEGIKGTSAKIIVYSHHRLDELEKTLNSLCFSEALIVTESIFSKTATISNLSRLISIKNKARAILYVDDSHSLGIMGQNGIGLCAPLKGIDFLSGSFDKALGIYGAYLAFSTSFAEMLSESGSYLSHHLLPPSILGALEIALDLIPQMDGERKELEQKSYMLKKKLKELDFQVSSPNIPFISVSFPSIDQAVNLKDFLEKEHIIIALPSLNRVNLILNHAHTPDQLNLLLEKMKAWKMNVSNNQLIAN